MAKILVVYGTTTGNTEVMAEEIASELLQHHSVDIEEVSKVTADNFNQAEVILAGSSTWQDGELQDDWIDFESTIKTVDLAGKKGAAFGPGSTSYPQFAKAVDIIEEFLQEQGAEIISENLKIDGDVDEQIQDIKSWAKQLPL